MSHHPQPTASTEALKKTERHQRWELLHELDSLTDKPMIVLSFIWLGLIIFDLTTGLSPEFELLSNIIWGLFIVDLLLGLLIAPRRLDYLQQNWLTVVSVALPALRILRMFRLFRVLRALRVSRSLNLLKVLTSARRGTKALHQTLRRRGVGYTVILTAVLVFLGAAGMAHFESVPSLQEAGYETTTGLKGYGDALWWTAMIMTTMGSEYWPQSIEGRILGYLLSLYAFIFLGYTAAAIASHFVSADIHPDESAEAASDEETLHRLARAQDEPRMIQIPAEEWAALRQQAASLQLQLGQLAQQLESAQPSPSDDS